MESNLITALYCRTACECDSAIEAQESLLLKYAGEHGLGEVSVYSDSGYSGQNFDRPAFTRLKTDIASGVVQTVLVKDFYRISRDIVNMYEWAHSDALLGVKVISVVDGCDIRAGNSINKLFKQFCALSI